MTTDEQGHVLVVLLVPPAGHQGTGPSCLQLGGQMKLLAISHLALTMQFPLNCKVHTAKCDGVDLHREMC